MIETILILTLILSFAGFAKAVMDRSSESNLTWSPSDYWIKAVSWRRKWKWERTGVIDENTGLREIVIVGPAWGLTHLLGHDVTFLGLHSAGLFAFLTDGWHLAQFASLNGLAIGSALAFHELGFPGLAAALAVYKVAFQQSYDRLAP